eukprot:TRINITY_DN21947_c0_g1_i3.p1 TRINITY_DN21947_c0_g1~~TRINITY_DN21947_c0_g1_i3.p1  ORF type:complete len:439 (+),score=65.52 TRINITY_DN21947_c0_g1_i3:43-1359(+)
MMHLNMELGVVRGVVLVMCCFMILMTSGVIFGWPSLLLVFQEENLFKNLCTRDETGKEDCTAQLLKFNLIYTLGQVSATISPLPFGIFLDRFGPRLTTFIGSIGFALSSILISYSNDSTFDAYIPGFMFLQIFGSGIFLGLIKMSEFFKSKDAVLAVFNICFDASTVVFFFYLLIYRSTHLHSSDFFKYFAIVPVFSLILGLFWPVPKDAHGGPNESTPIVESKESGPPSMQVFWRIIRSRDYLLWAALYMPVTLAWMNMYLGTVKERLSFYANEEQVVFLVEALGAILPSVLVVSPFIGYFIDRFGYKVSYLFNHFLGVVWVILISVDTLPYLQIGTFIIFTLLRALYWGNAMVYAVKLLGFTYFGKGWGLMVLIAGLLNLIPYFLLDLVLSTFKGNFLILNYVLIACWLLCFFFPIFLQTRWHRTDWNEEDSYEVH